MVFTLKFFNSVISLHFKNSVHGLFRTDKLKLYHRDVFLANYLLALGSQLQSADDPPWTAESSKNMRLSQDQARKLQLSFFCNYIHCLSWQRTLRQFMKSTATEVMQCLLGVMYSHWLQFSSPSAWGYLRGRRANCLSIHVCCYKQQAGIDRYLLLLPATLVFLLL